MLPAAGTYTARVNPRGTVTGTATLALYTVPPDASATVTPGGGTVGLTMTAPGQNAQLTFAATAGQRVSLLTQLDSSLSAQCFNVRVTAPDGSTQLYSRTTNCGSSDFSGVLPAPPQLTTSVPTLASSGTYTILLNPGNLATGTASFTLYAVPPDAGETVTVGAAASSYDVTAPGQAVRVTFTGSASQHVTISANAVSTQPSGQCYRVSVLKPDGATTLRGDNSCSAGYSSGSLTLPVEGTYTVVLQPSGTTVGTYKVGVSTP